MQDIAIWHNICTERRGIKPTHVSVKNPPPVMKHYLLTFLHHGAESFLRSWPVNFAASQEIPRTYGTRKSLTIPTSAHHLSLSWANSIQSSQAPPTSCKIHLNIILLSTSWSNQWPLSLRLPHQHPVHTSILPHTHHVLCPSHLSHN
jgi:hypothetical protein